MSKLLVKTLLFNNYNLSKEYLLWKAHYGLPIHALIYIKRFISNIPKGFVTEETSMGIIVAAIVSARYIFFRNFA